MKAEGDPSARRLYIFFNTLPSWGSSTGLVFDFDFDFYDMMLAISARQRGRRCTVLSFFSFFFALRRPLNYLPVVLVFSTTPVFPNSPLFLFSFFPLFMCEGAPAIFHSGNRRSPA